MKVRDFLKAGHPPTLLCAFLYFDTSFMVWVLIGALASAIAPEFDLSHGERGLMVALPLLGGAILRVVLGLLSDRIGARRTGILGLVLTLVPLLLGWLWVDDFAKIIVVGLLLGVAGASFAVALPLASRWYPPQYQGLAMGLAGAGNSGTALATFFAPRLIPLVGWHGVFGLALIPIVLTLIVFVLFAKDSPQQPPPISLRSYGTLLRQRDTWWFCVFYSVTFGGFVGLASFLNSYFTIQFPDISAAEAGTYATLCVIAGSFLRPVGGYLADRFGGIRMLTALFAGVGVLSLAQAFPAPMLLSIILLFGVMGLLGMGNGAVFQLVPLRFPREIGVITGIVGAAGGIGGFLLPTILGGLMQWTNTFAGGFILFAVAGFLSALALNIISKTWAFVGEGGKVAGQGVAVPVPEPNDSDPGKEENLVPVQA